MKANQQSNFSDKFAPPSLSRASSETTEVLPYDELINGNFDYNNQQIIHEQIYEPIITQKVLLNFKWIEKVFFTFSFLSIFLFFTAALTNYQNISLNYFSVYISLFTVLLGYFQYNDELTKPQYFIFASFTIVFLISLFQPYTGFILSTLGFLYIIYKYFEYPNNSQDVFKLMSVFFLYFSFSFFLLARINSVSYDVYYSFLSMGILSFCFFQFNKIYSFVFILLTFLFIIESTFPNLDEKISNYLFNFIMILSIVKFTSHMKNSNFFNFKILESKFLDKSQQLSKINQLLLKEKN